MTRNRTSEGVKKDDKRWKGRKKRDETKWICKKKKTAPRSGFMVIRPPFPLSPVRLVAPAGLRVYCGRGELGSRQCGYRLGGGVPVWMRKNGLEWHKSRICNTKNENEKKRYVCQAMNLGPLRCVATEVVVCHVSLISGYRDPFVDFIPAAEPINEKQR